MRPRTAATIENPTFSSVRGETADEEAHEEDDDHR